MRAPFAVLLLLVSAGGFAGSQTKGKGKIDPNYVIQPGAKGEDVMSVQILLDRAHFSPGEIDAAFGENLTKAVQAFQMARKLPVTGKVDQATWDIMQADTAPGVVNYTITPKDVRGPFFPKAGSLEESAKLKSLGYTSALEALAERYHSSPEVLEALNPGVSFDKAGMRIRVPNIHTQAPAKAASVVVDCTAHTVAAYDASGAILAFYPASTGTAQAGLEPGELTVVQVKENPAFQYNPDVFWETDRRKAKAKLPPGPNNPVGLVWIQLSREQYGIHGTADPSTVGAAQERGSIRLTNWDALELSRLVKKGTPAIVKRRS